jgi:Coenzyme PQQ synthesis protein D (PqqD)
MTMSIPRNDVILEFIFDDHLLLFNAKTKRLYALNHTSRFIWQLYKREKDLRVIVEALVSRFAVSREQALHDSKGIIADWLQVGLLESPVKTTVDNQQYPPVQHVQKRQNAHLNIPSSESCDFIISGRRVQIICDEQETMAALNNILYHLRTLEYGSVDMTVSVCRDKDHFTIAVNDIPLHAAVSHDDVIAWVHFELIAYSYHDRHCMAVLHSGAVCKDGEALLFPGSRGRGKSTLIAALQEHGFAYLSDDVCPLTDEEGLLVPVPMSQSLKKKSWPVLDHILPSLADQPEQTIFGCSLKYVKPATGDASLWDQTWPVRMLIFPEYLPHASFTQHHLSPLQALTQIINSGSVFGENISGLLQWLENKTCFAIRYSSLDEAVTWIQSISVDKRNEVQHTYAEDYSQ